MWTVTQNGKPLTNRTTGKPLTFSTFRAAQLFIGGRFTKGTLQVAMLKKP